MSDCCFLSRDLCDVSLVDGDTWHLFGLDAILLYGLFSDDDRLVFVSRSLTVVLRKAGVCEHTSARPFLVDAMGRCLVLRSGSFCFSQHELSFDVSGVSRFVSSAFVCERYNEVASMHSSVEHPCVGFSMSFLLALVRDGIFEPDFFSMFVSEVDRYKHISSFCDFAYDMHVGVYTMLLDCCDGNQVLELLDAGYVLCVELERGTLTPSFGVVPERHCAVLFKCDDGRYGYADNGGLFCVSLSYVQSLGDICFGDADYEPWYDGCMIFGVRFGFEGCVMARYSVSDIVDMAVSLDDCDKAISPSSGEIVSTSDLDLTSCRLSSGGTFFRNSVVFRTSIRDYLSDVWPVAVRPGNYVRLNVSGESVKPGVVDFSAQPVKQVSYGGRDITPIDIASSDSNISGFEFSRF